MWSKKASRRGRMARWAFTKEWPKGHRRCTSCGRLKKNKFFHKQKNCINGRTSHCKACRRRSSKKLHLRNPLERRLFYAAKARAKEVNWDFDLVLEDIVIPELCPVFGVPLVGKHSPSLDRINSSLGYIRRNVTVMSKRANMLKNNGTLDEFRAIIRFLENV